MNERLIAFLYLLMRDELPTGTVARLINEVQKAETFNLISESLAAYAKELAGRLTHD